MKFEITRSEYKRFLELLMIAESVITTFRERDDEDAAPFVELIRKLYAYAPKMGMSRWVERYGENNYYTPTEKLYEDSQGKQFLDDFEEEFFWDTLAFRLARRDLIAEVGGVEAYRELDQIERFKLLSRHEVKYQLYFEKHGLIGFELTSPVEELEEQVDTILASVFDQDSA